MSTTVGNGNIIFGDGTTQYTSWTGVANTGYTQSSFSESSFQIATTAYVKAVAGSTQYWHDVKGRAVNSSYYNYYYRPMMVSMTIIGTGGAQGYIQAGGQMVVNPMVAINAGRNQYTFMVPWFYGANSYYISLPIGAGYVDSWAEYY